MARKEVLGQCETCPTPTPAYHASKALDGTRRIFCAACFKDVKRLQKRSVAKRAYAAGYREQFKTPYPGGRHAFFAKLKVRDAHRSLGKKLPDIEKLGTNKQRPHDMHHGPSFIERKGGE